MTIQWILGWWNLIFVVPFALALIYLGIYTLSGWTFGDADADTDADADVDAHIDADVDAHLDADVDAHVDADVDAHVDADVDAHVDADTDADVDGDADTDADTDADHDADHDTEAEGAGGSSQPSLALQALSWVGIGKVPASIVLMVLALSWGFIGFVTNQAAREPLARALHRDDPELVALVSLPIAAIGSLIISSLLSRLAARILPKNETYARRRHELLGSVGEALYEIDRKFGMASIRDDRGNLFQVGCRSEDETSAIHKGARVKLVGYNAREKLFYVVPA